MFWLVLALILTSMLGLFFYVSKSSKFNFKHKSKHPWILISWIGPAYLKEVFPKRNVVASVRNTAQRQIQEEDAPIRTQKIEPTPTKIANPLPADQISVSVLPVDF